MRSSRSFAQHLAGASSFATRDESTQKRLIAVPVEIEAPGRPSHMDTGLLVLPRGERRRCPQKPSYKTESVVSQFSGLRSRNTSSTKPPLPSEVAQPTRRPRTVPRACGQQATHPKRSAATNRGFQQVHWQRASAAFGEHVPESVRPYDE